MAVITCQGGVTINNCYNCMLMFACTFCAKKSHSTTNKSNFVSLEGKRNLTIYFGNITFHMKLTHFCSHIFITLVFLHRKAEIIINSQNMRLDETSGGHLFHLPWPTEKKGEAILIPRYWQHHSETQAEYLLQNNSTFNTLSTSGCSACHCVVLHRNQW